MLTLMTCALFFFNDTATTEIYTLSLHDALPISSRREFAITNPAECAAAGESSGAIKPSGAHKRFRSEEHTSELQSRGHLVCRLLLEKKKKSETPRATHTPRSLRSIPSDSRVGAF